MNGIGSKDGSPDYLMQFMKPESANENTIRMELAALEAVGGQ